jgi:large subunit ribosomal protein L21
VYAIIEDSGTQFRVSEGDILEVDLREEAGATGATVEFDRVLLLADGDDVKVGAPLVEGAKVTGEVVNPEAKGPKVRVFRFKRRKGYRKNQGHRQHYAQVRITKISA